MWTYVILVSIVTCGLLKRKKNELAVKEDRHKCCSPHTGEEVHCCFLVTVIEVACLPQNDVAGTNSEHKLSQCNVIIQNYHLGSLFLFIVVGQIDYHQSLAVV